MNVFFTIFFCVMLLFAGWIEWCTETYRTGIYHDKYGVTHEVPLSQHTPVDWQLESIQVHIEITRGLGKGKSITI